VRVLFIGDVHGRIAQVSDLLARVRSMFRIGAAIQVGDFGFFESIIQQAAIARLYFPVPLYVIDGNHEDHNWLHKQINRGETERWRKEHNLSFQPRGSIITLGSSRIGFLGGALNVDQPQNTSTETGVTNYIQRRQREEAASSFNRETPELIVTHTCPSGIGVGICGSRVFEQGVADYVIHAGFDPGPINDCGDSELTMLWRTLKIKPSAWVFGHFHKLHEAQVEGTRFVGTPMFNPLLDLPLVIWDTEERRLFILTESEKV